MMMMNALIFVVTVVILVAVSWWSYNIIFMLERINQKLDEIKDELDDL